MNAKNKIDFGDLQEKGVISRPTREWLEPLWQNEQNEAEEWFQQHADRQPNLFNDDEDDDDEFSNNSTTMEENSITLNGIRVSYLCDTRSVGHGNRVWHASIATCLYLTKFLKEQQQGHEKEEGNYIYPGPLFQSLELGAGTAIPSLYLAQLFAAAAHPTAAPTTIMSDNENSIAARSLLPFLHITDAKQYRNILQILLSIGRQPSQVREHICFRVSPHNWGEGIGTEDGYNNCDPTFFFSECPKNMLLNQYDLVIVSDCIYNPNYHAALLESIAATLKFPQETLSVGATDHGPPSTDTHGGSGDISSVATAAAGGGRAIVSFSLHGNTNDETVWNFIDMANIKYSHNGMWKLQALPIKDLVKSTTTNPATVGCREADGEGEGRVRVVMMEETDGCGRGGGWYMEETMKELDLWVANLEPSRWFAYLYEITWTPK